ncbi:TIR domain-containing protein [Micromonospora sp. NPDC023644]|uniref:TIR domain-containing protein n=1 Tax=Micromonospora sp. NPDC023644 TaxID=3154321 RepID=UPI0033E980A8
MLTVQASQSSIFTPGDRGIMAKSVFFSFHYKRDAARVQLVWNINALEGQPLLEAQEWEKVRREGDPAIEAWIQKQMAYKKAVIVLIGQETASRPWVQYEINKAWADKRPLLGIRIHGLSSFGSVDRPGPSPFSAAAGIPVFDPTVKGAYGRTDSQATFNNLVKNLEQWSAQGVVRS